LLYSYCCNNSVLINILNFLGKSYQHQQGQQSISKAISVRIFNNQFNALLTNVTQFLDKNCSAKLDKCKEFCSGLTISGTSNELLFRNEQLKPINDCETFKELFRCSELCRHWSWDEHDVIEHIITLSESKESQIELEKYKEFMATKVGMEIIFNTQSELPHDAIKLSLIVDKPYSLLTVEEYQKLKSYIFKTLQVSSYIKYPYIKVLYSSIHIDWCVPVLAADCIIKMASVKKQVLMEHSIVFVKIGDTTVFNCSENQVSILSLCKFIQ